MQIGEVAPPAAGNPDFFRRLFRMIKDNDRTPPFGRFDAAHEASRTGSEDENVNLFHTVYPIIPAQNGASTSAIST